MIVVSISVDIMMLKSQYNRAPTLNMLNDSDATWDSNNTKQANINKYFITTFFFVSVPFKELYNEQPKRLSIF